VAIQWTRGEKIKLGLTLAFLGLVVVGSIVSMTGISSLWMHETASVWKQVLIVVVLVAMYVLVMWIRERRRKVQ
jgi:hypothetical protein